MWGSFHTIHTEQEHAACYLDTVDERHLSGRHHQSMGGAFCMLLSVLLRTKYAFTWWPFGLRPPISTYKDTSYGKSLREQNCCDQCILHQHVQFPWGSMLIALRAAWTTILKTRLLYIHMHGLDLQWPLLAACTRSGASKSGFQWSSVVSLGGPEGYCRRKVHRGLRGSLSVRQGERGTVMRY